MEFKPTTPNAVWIALATLHKENPEKSSFQAKIIASKIKELDIQGASDATVSTHISSHCVANKPAQPDMHRKLIRIRQGWYRLFVDGDDFDESRSKGQIVPLHEMIPKMFHYLIDWYNDEYVNMPQLPAKISDIDYQIESKTLDENSEPIFSQITQDNSLQIPNEIMKSLNAKSGDHIAFIKNGDTVILKKAKVKLEI
jgi:hypothetical protein